MGKHNIRLKDLAKELGLSIPSVSRALNDKPDISFETKRKVFELAEKLHYQRNQFAINFKNQQSFIIGVIIPKIVHHFFSNIISGIINEAEKYGYNVMLFQSNESFESELKGVKTFQKSMIDGLIISLSDNTQDVEHLKHLQDHDVPVILIDRITQEIDAAKIICDDYNGAYIATEHLISIGKSKIAHITGSLTPHTTKERLRGYQKALTDHQKTFNEHYVINCNLESRSEGYKATIKLLSEKEIPDGIFCATDITAVGAIEAIKENGLLIPDDIAVIGFSNWEISSVVEPALSSISQPDYEMGKKAIELLIEELSLKRENKTIKHKTHIMKTALIKRESTIGKQ
ncbi:LacI family DNA-binding transcriptional regulator [Marivirga tractuosa]|uniref:LacI family DNA-binding transcriptional regulator n=1 Tax=Marivirga tractuosa TaxID=1006 RepID=UPI0035D04503